MPKWLHKKLARSAKKRELTGEKFDAYVYGSLKKWKGRIRRIGKSRSRGIMGMSK